MRDELHWILKAFLDERGGLKLVSHILAEDTGNASCKIRKGETSKETNSSTHLNSTLFGNRYPEAKALSSQSSPVVHRMVEGGDIQGDWGAQLLEGRDEERGGG